MCSVCHCLVVNTPCNTPTTDVSMHRIFYGSKEEDDVAVFIFSGLVQRCAGAVCTVRHKRRPFYFIMLLTLYPKTQKQTILEYRSTLLNYHKMRDVFKKKKRIFIMFP